MTAYILSGGSDTAHTDYIKSLAEVVVAKVHQPKILGVWFSGSEEQASQLFPEFRDFMLPHFPEGTHYERAVKERFVEQVRKSDVIYFHGGSTNILIPAMQQYPDIERELEGKIVIGSSAGANYLADYHWSPSRGEVGRGSGILDVAIVGHYGSAGFLGLSFTKEFWEKAAREVEAASGKDVLLIPEGKFVVIERNSGA